MNKEILKLLEPSKLWFGKIKKAKKRFYVLSNKRIEKGDTVLAINGYFHWYGYPQNVSLTGFAGDDIGLSGCIRVQRECFKKILFSVDFGAKQLKEFIKTY